MLFLLPVAVVTAIRTRWRWSWSEWPLLLVFAVLTLLALSPVVTLGTTTLFSYDDKLWGPLSTFRASGRMFWPVYYGMVFVALAVVAGRLSRQWAIAVLAAAVVIQAADMSGAFRFTRQAAIEPFDDPLRSEFWSVVPGFYRHVVVYPTNMCAPLEQAIDYRFLARRASQAGATINAGNAMRFSAEAVQTYCETLAEDMMAGRVSDDTLYVLRPGGPGPWSRALQPMTCAEVDGFSMCFTSRSHERWRNQFGVVAMDGSPGSR